MNKDKPIRLFVNFSIIIGILLLLAQYVYFRSLPIEFYGDINVKLFTIIFSNYQGEVSTFDMMLVTLLVVFAANILVAVLVGKTEEVENKYLKEVLIYNSIILFMMVLSQILFALMIPDTVNGLIVNKFIFVNFPILTTNVVKAFNFNYILIVIYMFYNMFVSLKSIPLKEEIVEVIDEELYQDAIMESLQKDNNE